MVQSSITAWLKKPAPVPRIDSPTLPQAALSPPPASEQTVTSRSVHAEVLVASKPESDPSSVSKPFALSPLPPNVELVPLTEDLIPAFKRLNSLMLPIPYPTEFYNESMTEPHHGVTLMALWHAAPTSNPPASSTEKPHLVGAIRCRVLPSSTLYISTLCLLPPYRSHGIATHLLHSVIAKASKKHGLKCVTAHVWEANEDGLEWYAKRGFDVLERGEGYYRKLKPSGAILVRKWIEVGDVLAVAILAHGEKR